MFKIRELASFCLAMPGKNNNEDACLIPVSDRNKNVVFAIADGVGSLEGAENASTLAIECLNEELKKEVTDLEMVLDTTRIKLADLAKKSKDLSKATTTLSIVQLLGSKLNIIHIGDCRIYYRDNNNKLIQLTTDHNKYQEFLESKEYSVKKLKEHKDRLSRVLTKAISKDYEIKSDCFSVELTEIPTHDNCIFLYAMTDGAYKHWEKRPRLSDRTMSSPISFASSLKRRIERNVAEDDYTLIAVSISL